MLIWTDFVDRVWVLFLKDPGFGLQLTIICCEAVRLAQVSVSDFMFSFFVNNLEKFELLHVFITGSLLIISVNHLIHFQIDISIN